MLKLTERQAKALFLDYVNKCREDDLDYCPDVGYEWELFLEAGKTVIDNDLILVIGDNKIFYLEEII